MTAETNVVGLEFIVRRLSDAVNVFCDAFGWKVVFRGPSGEVAGEVAVLDAGSITVTLLEPADHGPGLLSDRTPRLSQLVVGGPPDDTAAAVDRLVRLGLPTHAGGPGRRFVPPEVVTGVLGFETAVMVMDVGDGE